MTDERPQSQGFLDRALEVIPMATQTHSKAARSALRGIEPGFLVRGRGCRVNRGGDSR